MPSFSHELFVEMFRDRPELARELLRAAGVAIVDGRVEAGSIDLSQSTPAEYRADWITVIRDETQATTAAIIVEVQLQDPRLKRWTWPVYVTTLRDRLQCPVTLLVFSPDDRVVHAARLPIEIGHPGFCLVPIVIGLADVPRITDPARARAAPELAVLSALAHRDVETAESALLGINELPGDKGRLYFELVLATLPGLAERILEERMKDSEPQSNWARRLIAQGCAEGRVEGREEGFHEAVVILARAKVGELSPEHEELIRALPEAAVRQLIIDLVNAGGEADAVAVLARLRS